MGFYGLKAYGGDFPWTRKKYWIGDCIEKCESELDPVSV